MKHLPYFGILPQRPSAVFVLAILLIAVDVFLQGRVIAGGGGGVSGGCAYKSTVNGATKYSACNGLNLPMWYPAAQNGTYNDDPLPCGTFGNQNCGAILGSSVDE